MKGIGVFVDTCIVNRLVDIDKPKEHDATYEEDRRCLMRVVKDWVESGTVVLFVNPAVKAEIEETPDPSRRQQLLERFNKLRFTAFNTTVFPIYFPGTFVPPEEVKVLDRLLPSMEPKDRKILADAIFSDTVGILLTTDRRHLANAELRTLLNEEGVDKNLVVLTPKELCDHLLHTL